jgi:hypothetical protein
MRLGDGRRGMLGSHPHPDFIEESKWLADLNRQVPGTFEDLLAAAALNLHLIRNADELHYTKYLSVDRLRDVTVVKQGRDFVTRSHWLDPLAVQTSLEFIEAGARSITDSIQQLNLSKAYASLQEIILHNPEITIDSSGEFRFRNSIDKYLSFSVARIYNFTVQEEIETHTLLLEWGCIEFTRDRDIRGLTKQATLDVIKSAWLSMYRVPWPDGELTQ